MPLHQRIMFSYKARWIPYWDLLIILLALVNCILVPLETAVELDYTKEWIYEVLNVIFDVLFFIDILISFNTSLNINNDEIHDRTQISLSYLRGQFTIDFLSAVPIDVLASIFFKNLSAKQLKIISLLKLIRMLRLTKIVRALRTSRDIKSQIKLFILLLKLILYIHCSACLQLFIIQYESLWDHPIYSSFLGWESKFAEDSVQH